MQYNSFTNLTKPLKYTTPLHYSHIPNTHKKLYAHVVYRRPNIRSHSVLMFLGTLLLSVRLFSQSSISRATDWETRGRLWEFEVICHWISSTALSAPTLRHSKSKIPRSALVTCFELRIVIMGFKYGRWLAVSNTHLKGLCHDLRMCRIFACSVDFFNCPPYWI